jgi:3-deoxy-7-phosphoheptulonate synthase
MVNESTDRRVSDLYIAENSPLPSPSALFEEVTRTDAHADVVFQAREDIQSILQGEDKRFLLVVGPCSIHDVKAGKEYAERIAALSEEVKDRMLLVMRGYFEKPRTTIGWKGLIMDPHLDNSADIQTGLREARRFLCQVLELGLPTATELLDPITPQYIADLICWSAIGARTTESQTHRQMASGLSMPLGFKNATSGSVGAAVDAIGAATQPQTFLGVNREGVASCVTTHGNPHCHIILRGGSEGPNYDEGSVAATIERLEKAGQSQAIMIDASHANSNKDHRLQPEVFRNVIDQRVAGNEKIVAGMIESNLEAGNQSLSGPLSDLTYGQSVTDKCLDWDTTVTMVKEAYDKLGA